MLSFVLRKMLRNWWLVLCLLGGLITATALVSSIPTYSMGVMRRILIEDLEELQEVTGKYPGRYLIVKDFWQSGEDLDHPSAYPEYDRAIESELVP